MKVKGTARRGGSGSRQLCTPPQTDTGVSQHPPLRQQRQTDTGTGTHGHTEKCQKGHRKK